MAGLVGIIAEQPDTRVPAAELDSFVGGYRSLRAEPEITRLDAGSRAAVAVLGNGAGSAGVEHAHGSWAAYVGQPYADAGSVLSADPQDLDGQFALLRYDERAGRIQVLSDPFGLQALYIANRDGLVYFSTSVLAIAKHLRARPDKLGMEVFLRSGPHFGALTNWEGINRVQPATLCSYGPHGSQTALYWRPAIDRRVSSLGLDDAARECVEVATETFQRRFGPAPHAWCDLSGGYDTRLAALLLGRAGVRFRTTTNGSDADLDTVIARRVASSAGWVCARGELGSDWPATCKHALADALAWGDGTLEATQLAEVLALQGERAQPQSVLFNGGGGEHWRDYAWKQEIPFGGRTTRVNFERWASVRFLHPIDTSVFKSDPTARTRASIVDRCRAYVEPYAGELNSAQLDMLYAYKAMAHFGAYQSASRGTIRVELPFYARPVFLAAFSVAPRHRNCHRLARAAIAMLDPHVAELPTSHGDLATPVRLRNAHRFAPFLYNRARGAARKLTQNLPGPTIGALTVETPEPVQLARRRALESFTRQTGFDPDRMRTGAVYDGHALRRLACSPEATTNGWSTLGRIITAELALAAVGAEVGEG